MLQNLPELFLDLVCGHLSYEDVLALRSTCKGLKQFVDAKEFLQLNLFVRKYSYHHQLFYTDDWICYQHSLHSDDLTILTANRFRERFRGVQRMIICTKTSSSDYKDEDARVFYLSCLNHFRALCHLEINEMPGLEGKLDLPDLQIAAFQTAPNAVIQHSWIELNCPRLRALKIDHCNPALTCETDQLEYLEYCHDHDQAPYLKSINANLRKLSTICFELGEILLEFLSDLQTGRLILPSLSEIHMKQFPALIELKKLKSSLKKLRSDSRTKRIKFILVGRLIDSPKELSRIADLIQDHPLDTFDIMINWTLFFEDAKLLLLNGTPQLEFLLSAVNCLELKEDTELTEQMIKKLKNVSLFHFRGGCKPSVSTFELIAKNCKLIDTLILHNQTLTERLLEILSKDLLNLTCLFIRDCEYETLKPLAKFRNLEEVHLNFSPPRDELTFIYENSRTLEVVVGKKVALLRTTTRPKMHRITLDTGRTKSERYYFRTLHSMINYCYENRLFEERDSGGTSTRLINESSTSPQLESND